MPSGVVNFPTSLDDAVSLIEANNQASSTLTASIIATTLLIPVADPAEFPNSGLATLTDSITPWTAAPTKIEIFRYSSKSGSNLVVPSTADRGLYGTTAQSWDSGQFVGQRITARHHTVLAEAQIAVETKLGIGSDTPGGSGEALLSDSSGASVWRAIAQADVSGLVSALSGKAATVHTHAQSDITGLVSDLSGKAATVHTHLKADITDFANDTITLSGDVTGSGAAAISATIANDAVTYAKLQNISATQRVLGRNTSGAGNAEEVTASQLLDWIGSTRGSVLYRGASGWAIRTPGTAGQVLTSNGANEDPTYEDAAGGGGGDTLPIVDTTAIVKGSADATKLLRFEVDGFTAETTRTLTPQNASYTLAGLNIAQTFTDAQGIQANAASAFFVGQNGDTNPALRVVANVVSAATGLSITGNASGAGVTLTALSSGSNENIILTPKGTGMVESTGPLRLSGTGTDTFTTPASASVPTKLNIPLFNPGSFGQILAFGMASGAANSARVLSLFDQRGSGHQPTLQVFNPAEDSLFGLTWDGSDAIAQLTTSAILQLTGTRVFIKAPNSAPTDGDIPNSCLTMRLDEAGDEISIRVRYSDGTLKTGVVALT